MKTDKQMKYFSNEFYERIDRLFRQLKSCDTHLIGAEITDDDQKVNAAYLFSISSYGLSFINSVFSNNAHSPGTIMDMRCIFENIAMYYHYLNGGFSDDGKELFKLQHYILEREIYKKYPCFDGLLYFSDEVEKSYFEARQAYKGKLELNAYELQRIIKSPVPSLLKDDMAFIEIVEKNLGENAAAMYKQLSVLVHPHDYRSTIDNIFIDIEIEKNPYIQITLHLLEEVFADKPKGEEVSFGLMEEWICYMETPHLTSYQAREIIFSLNDELKNVLMVAYENRLPSLARMLDQIRGITTDYLLDNTFGYTEQGEIKWKVVVEYFALFNYYLNNPYYIGNNYLAYWHTQIACNKALDREITQETKDKCYAEYIIVFPNGVDKATFEQVYFEKTLGFLIDEKGEIPSLNKLAKDFLSQVSPTIYGGKRRVAALKVHDKNTKQEWNPDVLKELADGKRETIETPLKEWLMMIYEESQIMSHATGYLFFANTGAWMDGQYLGEFVLKFMQYILKRLCDLLGSPEIKQKLNGKTLLNITRNYLKNSAQRIEVYGQMLRFPKGGKPKF